METEKVTPIDGTKPGPRPLVGKYSIEYVAGDISKQPVTPADLSSMYGKHILLPGVQLDKTKPMHEQGTWLIVPPTKSTIGLDTAFGNEKAVREFCSNNGVEYLQFLQMLMDVMRSAYGAAPTATVVSICLDAVLVKMENSQKEIKLEADYVRRKFNDAAKRHKAKAKQQKKNRKKNRK